jgi:hypothetical protein
MHNVSLIKYLYQSGYRQKLICIITGYNQSIVSKHCNNPRSYIPTLETANENQLRRKMVVDRICECRVLKKYDGKMFSEQDTIYMKLLDFCLIDRDKIRQLYRTTTQYKISNSFRKQKDIIKNFEPLGLDIQPEDWELFLEQCKF